MGGIDPTQITPEELARVSFTAAEDPVVRCVALIAWLEETMSRLQNEATSARARKFLGTRIDKLWAVHVARSEKSGTRTRRLANILETASRMRESAPLAAPYLFVRLLGLTEARALRRVASSLVLLEECLVVWRRRSGAPRITDLRRPKWTVFAELHERLGFGEIDPEDARKECSPSRRKKGRKPRH
jgi:hypothetical protein